MVFISILGLLYMQEKAATNNFIFLCKIYYLIIVGITFMQNYVIIGVRYKSPTLAFALANLIPAFTFLLGVIFRLSEARLGWNLVGVISHYPSVLSVLLDVLILVIMACIGYFG
ncbi:hypothetical protein V6Z11_D11G207200 [Gossypium hirsutum]